MTNSNKIGIIGNPSIGRQMALHLISKQPTILMAKSDKTASIDHAKEERERALNEAMYHRQPSLNSMEKAKETKGYEEIDLSKTEKQRMISMEYDTLQMTIVSRLLSDKLGLDIKNPNTAKGLSRVYTKYSRFKDGGTLYIFKGETLVLFGTNHEGNVLIESPHMDFIDKILTASDEQQD